MIASHRLRSEEKKLYHKLMATVVFFIFLLVLAIYVGLPLFARIIVTVTSLKGEMPAKNNTSSTLVFPPLLDPLPEATNSSSVKISGYAESEATIRIFVNDKEVAKVLVDNEGKFLTSKLSLKEGFNTITATAIKDQQESSPSASVSIICKKSSPKLEITSPKEDEKISGETKEITIAGETDSGAKISINDRVVIVGQNGKFNHRIILSDGENNFKITATDEAGNQTILERKVTYTP